MEIKWLLIALAIIFSTLIISEGIVDIEKEKTKQIELQLQIKTK